MVEAKSLVPPHTLRTVTPGRITRRPEMRHGLDHDGRVLHCGLKAIPIAAVEHYRASGQSTKDLSTAFATIAIFCGVAALLAFGVVELGWRTRMLVEGVLFGALGVCAIAELFSSRRQTLFTFELTLLGGERVDFVTADTDEAQRIHAVLQTGAAGTAGRTTAPPVAAARRPALPARSR